MNALAEPIEGKLPRRSNEVAEIAVALNTLLADTFALYIKTKNFHWHMSGPHFRDYHLLLDEQADQIFATTDPLAERVRKLGHPTLRSIGDIRQAQRILDSDVDGLTASSMLAQLLADNQAFVEYMRAAHVLCDQLGDVATASLLEVWIDEADRRVWFLRETATNSH